VNETSELFENAEHRPAFLVGAAAVVLGLCFAAWVSWTCDDAFISFRYARNLAEGHGLVFNVGERVEGYTNLLWTLWIAIGLRLGLGAEPWASIFGLVFYGASLSLLFAFHLDLRRALPVRRATLPLACLVGAVHPDWRLFATSGLETSAFTAVVLAGYLALARGLIARRPRPLLSGAIFGVASMLRPDGMVFAAVAALAVALAAPRRLRDAAWFVVGVGTFWAGTTAFRLGYYGEYFPNTYYAKSAYLPWHRQGSIYVATYFHKYWVLLLGPMAVAFFAWRARGASPSGGEVSSEGWRWYRVHALLATGFAAAYTYYVVRVGGDFMYARLLVPVTPYLALLFELGLYRLCLTRQLLYVEVSVACLLLILLIPRPVSGTEWRDGIADEAAVYDDEHLATATRDAEVLTHFFRGLPVRAAFLGTEARLMYEANVPVAIEAETGLTDRAIARQPLAQRARIGHEKRATMAYLVSVRAAHFLFTPSLPEEFGLDRYIPVRTIAFGPVTAWILHWDPRLMAELGRRGASFDDFGGYLDRYIDGIGTRSPDEVRRDHEKFRHFYFEHVQDPREEGFVAARRIRPDHAMAPP
jgi:hypothetical protein